MRDIGPVIFVIIVKAYRRAEAFTLNFKPYLTQTLGRQFAALAFIVIDGWEDFKEGFKDGYSEIRGGGG